MAKKKTEHQIDGEQAEEQSIEEKKKAKTDAERARMNGEGEEKSVSKKQFLAPGPANSGCHGNTLPSTHFAGCACTHTERCGRMQRKKS